MKTTTDSLLVELEGLEPIRTPDCIDLVTLFEIDAKLTGDVLEQLGENERWHLGMGCARCHHILMLLRSVAHEEGASNVIPFAAPRKTILRVWRSPAPQFGDRAADPDGKGILPVRYELDDGNIIVTFGVSGQTRQHEVRIWSASAREIGLRVFGEPAKEPEGPSPQIEWSGIRLAAGERFVIPMEADEAELFARLKVPQLEVTEPDGQLEDPEAPATE